MIFFPWQLCFLPTWKQSLYAEMWKVIELLCKYYYFGNLDKWAGQIGFQSSSPLAKNIKSQVKNLQ